MKQQISELLKDSEWAAFLTFMALLGLTTKVVGAFLLFGLMAQQ